MLTTPALLLCIVLFAGDVMAGIEVGYSNVREDTVAGATVLESGSVPTWIDGESCFVLFRILVHEHLVR